MRKEKNNDEAMYDLHTFENALSEIDISTITDMGLVLNSYGEPSVSVTMNQGREIHFPITNGFRVHHINEWLRSFVCNVSIEFHSYKQYGEMIKKVNAEQFGKVGVVNG